MRQRTAALPRVGAGSATRWWRRLPPVVALGAAATLLAAWLPWLSVARAPGRPVTLLGGADVAGALLLRLTGTPGVPLLAWSVISVCGLWLAPLLWLRAPRWGAALAAALLALWAAALLALWLVAALFAATGARQSVLTRCAGCAAGAGSLAPLPGFALAAAGPVLALVGGVALLGGARRGIATRRPTPLASGRHRGGLLVAGLLVWALGFFAMPWATARCTQQPLLIGQCTGISASGAFAIAIGRQPLPLDQRSALYAVGLLLGGGALLLLAGVWLRQMRTSGLIWSGIWLLVARGVGAGAYVGVAALASGAVRSLPASGPWVGDFGLADGIVGLLLAWLGWLLLVPWGRGGDSASPA